MMLFIYKEQKLIWILQQATDVDQIVSQTIISLVGVHYVYENIMLQTDFMIMEKECVKFPLSYLDCHQNY